MDVEKKVRDLISNEVEQVGVVIDSVLYEKEGGNNYLRIVIDSEIPIDIDKCVEVTNIINPILDQNDIIEESYILDISSKERGNADE